MGKSERVSIYLTARVPKQAEDRKGNLKALIPIHEFGIIMIFECEE
jgi:hypothetical protein